MESQLFSNKDLKLKLPFGMILSGPSSSGKSSFLLKFIVDSQDLIEPKPKNVVYCFGEMSTNIPILQKSGVNVYAGVPSEELIKKFEKPLLLILDDLLLSIDEKYLSELLRVCHKFCTPNFFLSFKFYISASNKYFLFLFFIFSRAFNSLLFHSLIIFFPFIKNFNMILE
jgi:hypothetical protein